MVTSGMEHNSVMRPLRELERQGTGVTVVQCSPTGWLDPADIAKSIRPNTKMVVLNHASNVTGGIAPVREAGRICRERDILLLVDSAQTAGCLPIDMENDFIDMLAFTGHKSLLGPQGTGGLVLGGRVDIKNLRPLKQGGTGSRSEFEIHPDFMPDMCESGTPNTVGIAGLGEGVDFVANLTVEKIRAHELGLMTTLINRLLDIPRVMVIGDHNPATRVATISFTIEGMSPSEAGLRLDEEHGILCRVGLHCAPAAHRTLGTFPQGAIRFGLGYFNTGDQIDRAARALAVISR